MSDVIFEEEKQMEEKITRNSISGANMDDIPFMYGLLIKWGIAKTVKQASIILFAFAVVLLAVSGFIFYSQNKTEKPNPVYKEDIPEDLYNSLPIEIRSKIPSKK